MRFNLGAGLSELGKGVAQTAQAWTLEAQRAEIEKEKVILADQLMGKREGARMAHVTSEREAGQTFLAGEHGLDRAQKMDITRMQMENAVKTAQISAGPGYARVALDREQFQADAPLRAEKLEGQRAETSLKKAQAGGYEEEHSALVKQREAQTRAYDSETLSRQIKADADKNLLDARKELDEAVKVNDPERIAAAQKSMYVAEFSAKDEVQRVSLAQAQAKLWETAMNQTQTRLAALQDPMKQMDPGAKALTDQLTKQLEDQRRQFNAAAQRAQELERTLPRIGQPQSNVTGTIDLNQFVRKPAPKKAPLMQQGPQ